MGQVWLGTHAGAGVPVAVKVMKSTVVHDTRFVAAFNDEVRLAASLEHPGIVTLLDYGKLPDAAERDTAGELRAGTPYLVMEFVEGGGLDKLPTPMAWAPLRDLLLALLDALAHAHARGVVHRDLKPGNVLLVNPRGPADGIRLSDFGLARAFQEAPAEGSLLGAGTPEYMAPEQVERRWRDQGPWTDLYALGCMAWLLASGRHPFRGPTRVATARLHLSVDRPTPPSPSGYPLGFGPWLARMMALDPADRPATAAEAARGLAGLDREARLSSTAETPSRTFTVELDWDEARPFPDWRAPAAPRPPTRLVGAGLGLFDLRPFPMTDRDEERDRIWGVLREVAGHRSARAVLVEGGLGVGRSRLARALGERLMELGLGTALTATHARVPGPGDGLLPILHRHLRLGGLAPPDAESRVQDLLGGGGSAADVAALLRNARPAGVDERERAAWAQEVLLGLLDRVAGDRVLLVVVDDAQWGADALAFVRHVLTRRAADHALLFVICADPGEGPEDLAWLRTAPRVPRLALPPLPPALMEGLIHGALAFDETAAADVSQRSGGNPLFAIQMVRDWARRGLLRVGPRGFAPASSTAALPSDLRSLWSEAIGRVLEGFPARSGLALEVAAALGAEVVEEEWSRIAAATGAAPPPGLTEALLRAQLVERTETGWRFVHRALQEHLEAEAKEAGRWTAMHRVIADVLRAGTAPDGLRLGRHLVESGDATGALDALLAGCRKRLDAFAFREAEPGLRLLRERVLDGDTPPPTDRRRGEAAVLEVRALIGLGRLADAERAAGRAADLARVQRWPDIRARALRYRAMALEKAGSIPLAEAVFTQAELLSEQVGDEENLAACLEHRGTLLRQQGDLPASRQLLEEALGLTRTLGQPRLQADCLKELGGTLVLLGDRGPAEAALREAAAVYRSIGSAPGEAECLNNLAELERAAGRLDDAETSYRAAFGALEGAGHQATPIPLLNIAQIQLARASFAEAQATLARALVLCRGSGRRSGELYALVFLLPCRAAARAWARWDDELQRCTALTDETGLVDKEVADALGLAADLAEGAGERGRADEARALAGRHRTVSTPRG